MSYLAEIVEEATNVRKKWEVDRRVMKQQLKSLHEALDLRTYELDSCDDHSAMESLCVLDGVAGDGGQDKRRKGEPKSDDGDEADGGCWVMAMDVRISNVTVLLSVHEVTSTNSLRVIAFEPLKVCSNDL